MKKPFLNRYKLIFGLFALLLAGGCSVERFHLVKISPQKSNIPTVSEMVFENDTLRVAYNFWENFGLSAFTITNKLDIPLYIDWSRSKFYVGDRTYQYWYDKKLTTLSSYSVSVNNRTRTSMVAETTGQESSAFLAPHSSHTFEGFTIGNFYGIFNRKGYDTLCLPYTYKNDTQRHAFAKIYRYTDGTTPVHLRNFLTLSTSADFKKDEFYVDNSFYVSEILSLSARQFRGKVLDNGNPHTGPKYQLPYRSPGSYYYRATKK